MTSNSNNANYGGRQPNTSAYVKSFNYGRITDAWYYSNTTNTTSDTNLLLLPSNSTATVTIPGNLVVEGSINIPSDVHLKRNIQLLSLDSCDKILSLNPVSYRYIDDQKDKLHFGMIAQEVETLYPNLVNTISTEVNNTTVSMKAINYIEIIPILLVKIKDLQSQIDVLNTKIVEK
uniref:Peptidase S74 domain-containing protein n=1 Tax=viral metagenome TaxID=1070528 RepID=A0A6C0AZ83_9ZZZZ